MSKEMPTVKPRSSLDGLPKQFVSSLRVLFDILDDEKTGFVKFSDIESRWQGDGVKGLPPGVVTALQKVTPANGLLSFERFVAGLKITLLRNKSERPTKEKENEVPFRKPNFSKVKLDSHTQPGGGNVNDRPVLGTNKPNHLPRTATTATVRPSNFTAAQRSNSVPHLPGDVENDHQVAPETVRDPRQRMVSDGGNLPVKSEISNALRSWQRDRMINNAQEKVSQKHDVPGTSTVPSGGPGLVTQKSEAAMYRKTEPKRREPRRHTLGSGIDYNMIQRMKQLEQEKDVLLQGLEHIDKAREWYHRQIANVQEKQQYLSKTGPAESVSEEKYQERLNFVSARIADVNRQLRVLIESPEKGFPSHMNLATQSHQQRPPPSQRPPQSESESGHLTTMLKAQNRMLTKEVTQKSQRISQLEKEKVTLVRQLFEARSSKDSKKIYGDDTTFM